MENLNTQNLVEQIAQLLRANDKGSDDFLRSSLEKINQRLDKIEVHTILPNPKSQILNPKSFHPSQDKFINLEDLADEIISNLQNEKACPFEPTGKPCDNCSMCNSRGF